ncbi:MULTISPECIES: LexA regulated protein [Corallincola]|uniref:LexA regulated protein n=3 Tax=Corallincola TaxID=1775176 RepID=A0A368NMK3_9GAMM|nr:MULTISPECIES: LexA regulated protein [Corallincola]RCU50541.1 LexA regulated protein [Corallincola holothuriorum]TAA48452.1 LexA regulated protein [Corallincola spongiicola]TCI01865.1 LexA regulated protein [Corallincola luteus]
MAKENTDRTTIDLFEQQRRPGRPKTSPLSRDAQLKINKRNQLKRDKANGLKRVEVKLHQTLIDQLDAQCEQHALNRSAMIALILQNALSE